MTQFDPAGLMEETRTSNCKHSKRQDVWLKEEMVLESGRNVCASLGNGVDPFSAGSSSLGSAGSCGNSLNMAASTASGAPAAQNYTSFVVQAAMEAAAMSDCCVIWDGTDLGNFSTKLFWVEALQFVLKSFGNHIWNHHGGPVLNICYMDKSMTNRRQTEKYLEKKNVQASTTNSNTQSLTSTHSAA